MADIDDFLGAMEPRHRARALATLTRPLKEGFVTRPKHAWIEEWVREGAFIRETHDSPKAAMEALRRREKVLAERAPMNPAHPDAVELAQVRHALQHGIHVPKHELVGAAWSYTQADLTKTGMDYARFLIERTPRG